MTCRGVEQVVELNSAEVIGCDGCFVTVDWHQVVNVMAVVKIKRNLS